MDFPKVSASIIFGALEGPMYREVPVVQYICMKTVSITLDNCKNRVQTTYV